jgi:hypothetical protein
MEYAFDDSDLPDFNDDDWTDWVHSSSWSHDPYEFRYKTIAKLNGCGGKIKCSLLCTISIEMH